MAFAGWLLFLMTYIPMEICLYLIARCSVFFYYYPAACGVGLMVERIAGCTSKTAAFTRDTEVKLPVNQRQIIRVDWFFPAPTPRPLPAVRRVGDYGGTQHACASVPIWT